MSEPPRASRPGTEFTPMLEAMRLIYHRRLKWYLAYCIVLVLAFCKPLWAWLQFARNEGLFSHTLLVPLICAYLIWLKRDAIPMRVSYRPVPGMLLFAMGCLVLGVSLGSGFLGWNPALQNQIALNTFAFVLCFLGGTLFIFGTDICRVIAFPLGFLLFMVPLPTFVVDASKSFFQYTSAVTAYVMIKLTGTPLFKHGYLFQLPGLNIEVAQECSGIRSSFVLFLSSLLAGHLLLKNPWYRAWLALFVIPLGILRNGFRILTLSMLTVYWDPSIIDSPLHHRGGPIFFVLSLVPFFGFLVLLKHKERMREIKERQENE